MFSKRKLFSCTWNVTYKYHYGHRWYWRYWSFHDVELRKLRNSPRHIKDEQSWSSDQLQLQFSNVFVKIDCCFEVLSHVVQCTCALKNCQCIYLHIFATVNSDVVLCCRCTSLARGSIVWQQKECTQEDSMLISTMFCNMSWVSRFGNNYDTNAIFL